MRLGGGCLLCYFTRHMLGLAIDTPNQKVAFRPLVPWQEFTWNNCRIGAIEFDCSYIRRKEEIEMSIRNHADHSIEVTLQALLPERSKLLKSTSDRNDTGQIRQLSRYERIVVESVAVVSPGAMHTLRVRSTTPSDN